MKIPVIAVIALLSLPAIAVVSATAPLAESAAPAVRSLDMDAVPTLDQNAIRQVQLALQKKGIDPGPIDGVLGPRTRAAVKSFRDRYGIEGSGEIDNQTLFALGAVDLAGNPRTQ